MGTAEYRAYIEKAKDYALESEGPHRTDKQTQYAIQAIAHGLLALIELLVAEDTS